MLKKSLLILLFLITGAFLWANDSYVKIAGGSIIPIDSPEGSSHPSIQMKKEVIYITLNDKSYTVQVYFEFYNSGETATINVGFPEWGYGTTEVAKLKKFNTSVNGEFVKFKEIPNTQTQKENSRIKIQKWFVREITFPAKEITKTSVYYDCDYGYAGGNRSVSYLFGTGKTWNGPIEKQTIVITNKFSNIDYTILGRRTYLTQNDKDLTGLLMGKITLNKNQFTIQRENISPDYFDHFHMVIAPCYYIDYFHVDNSSLESDLIEPDDLIFFTNDQLRYLRNVIYAWHGHTFDSADLKAIFKKKDWYKPTHKVQTSEFNQTELKNLKTIMEEEKLRK